MCTRSSFILPLALLLACAPYEIVQTPSPPVELAGAPQGNMGKICVVRPQARALSYPAEVRDNGNLVGATRGQSYFCYLAEPGAHRLTTESVRQSEEATAYVTAGSTYYLQQSVDYGFNKVYITHAWIDQPAAESAARACQPVVLTARRALPQLGAVAPALRGGTSGQG